MVGGHIFLKLVFSFIRIFEMSEIVICRNSLWLILQAQSSSARPKSIRQSFLASLG